jgi:hypothetical protein
MIKRFRYEFEYNDDNDDRCILRQIESDVGYCYHLGIKCKGKFEDRPTWCPLVEVKEDK